MVDVAYDNNDRWNIPDDRQLALRGRLQTGWSSYQQDVFSASKKHSLTTDEHNILKKVLEKKEQIQKQEQARIGNLVKKLDDMRSQVLGDGTTTCLICGTKAGLLKDQLRYCFKCSKMVCPKCSIETKLSLEYSGKVYSCVLCFEERQLWKRSGAWFFNSMPKYTLPEKEEYRYGMMNRGTGSLYDGTDSPMSKGSVYNLHRNDDSESADEASDSDADETQSIKAFALPEDRRSLYSGFMMDDEDAMGITPRRNAVSGGGEPMPPQKKAASKTSSSESDHNTRTERKFTSQASLLSSDNSSNDERRGSATSLSSTETPRKKLGIRDRVLRKHSKGTEDEDRHSSKFERSPGQLRKTGSIISDVSIPSHNGASTEGSEQDIDALFQDYEKEQANKGVEQKEYTGSCGMIEFTLQYDQNTQELLVIVHNCKGLKGDKGKMPSLPYVKTYILPEAQKATKKRTVALKKVADPVYNETLVYYGVSPIDIENKGLKLCVMDENKNSVIGETSIPMKTLSTRPVQQFRRILDLKSNDSALFLDTKKTLSNPGRIELALHYLSKQGKLVVGVIRCSGLLAMDPNGYSDPYVKCYLLPDPHKRTKQKTQVKKKTLNPEFNEEFTYKIPHSELAKRTLHISVWDHDVGRSNDFIGGVTLGIEASGDLLRHWFETLQTQDRRVIKWHTLTETCPIIKE